MAAKRTASLLAGKLMAQAFDEAEDLWRPVYLSADAQEGPRAFKEKRDPIWRSR
jgi:1,4-dihydroxy-2-naphthoyl-CoA synthase